MPTISDEANIHDGGGDLEVVITLHDHEGGSTNCDLHIPHPDAGAQLASLIGSIPGVDQGLIRAIREQCSRIDDNTKAIEDWATYYIRNCCCVESVDLIFTGGT